MPYVVHHERWRSVNNQWVVRKADGGKVVGRHATKEKAEAQIRAIESNEHE